MDPLWTHYEPIMDSLWTHSYVYSYMDPFFLKITKSQITKVRFKIFQTRHFNFPCYTFAFSDFHVTLSIHR